MIDDAFYNDYLKLLLAGNRVGCETKVDSLLDEGVGVFYIYEKLFKRSLYEIGALWESNKIGVAVEHLATAITEGIMNKYYLQIVSQERVNNAVIVACVEGEHHQVGSKMVADVFEQHGWDAIFLGANTPVSEVCRFARDIKPDAFVLSLSVYMNLNVLLDEINQIRIISDAPILIGGQALQTKGEQIATKKENVHFSKDLESLETLIVSLWK